MHKIDQYASRIKWIYKKLVDKKQTEGMTLEQISEALEYV